MAPNVTAHFFAANDINGSPLHEITDEDTFFRDLKLSLDRDGLGSSDLLLSRSINFAGFASGTFGVEVFVRFLVHAYSDTDYYPWGLSLSKRQQVVVHKDEKGAEVFRFAGPGPKSLLQRHALGIHSNLPGHWNLDLANGVWRWTENASVGQILNRILEEDQARPDPSLPFLTTTFTASHDSNAVAWADSDLAADGLFEIPIGTDYLTILHDMGDVLELSSWIDLGTVASPKFELNVIQGTRNDYTGSAVGSSVCLLKEGLNIANDSLEVEGQSLRKASHVIVEGKDGHWVVAERPSYSPGDYVKYAKIEYTRSSSDYWLNKAGIRWLQRQDLGENEYTVELVPGDDDAAGYYFPAPDRVLWLDNEVSLDTSADGTTHSQLDVNPSTHQLVTGIELAMGNAGSTDSADAMARSWDVKAILNKERPGVQQKHPNQSSATSGASCRCTNGPPFPHECEPDPGDTLVIDNDDAAWIGTYPQTFEPDQTALGGPFHTTGASGGNMSWDGLADDTSYRLVLTLGGSSHAYTGYVTVIDSDAILPNLGPYYIVNGTLVGGGHSGAATFSLDFELPTGYDKFQLTMVGKMGGWRYRAFVYIVNDPVEGDPYCIPVGTGGTSPTVPRYDDPRFTADDQHLISRVAQRVTNNSGGTLAVGDVVVPDTSQDLSVTTTTTANSTAGPVGVVETGGDDGDEVVVVWFGYASYVRDTGTAADGDYLFTSTTAGAASTSATRGAGAFGRVVRDASGDVAYALLWGVPDSSSGGGGSVATDTIWDAKGDLAAGTGANTAAKLTVGSDDTILMADSGQSTGLKWVAAGTPSTQAFGDSATVGTSDTFTRGDHKHAMPADPVTAHEAASDPHTGYVLESLVDAKGDLIAGTADNTVGRLAVGANGKVLTAASGETTGLKWASGSDISITVGGSLGDVPPSSAGTYDQEFTGTADTLPAGSWDVTPSGSDLWSLNSRWPGLLTVEGTGNATYNWTVTSFTAASTFGIWWKMYIGNRRGADTAQLRMYVTDSTDGERRGGELRVSGAAAAQFRGLKRTGAGAENVWGTAITAGFPTTFWYGGMTRASNSWLFWVSNDGISWTKIGPAESQTFTVDRYRVLFKTDTDPGLLGVDWIRYRTDTDFPRP